MTLAGAQRLSLFNSAYTPLNSAASPAAFGGLVLNASYNLEGWHTNSSLSPTQDELWGAGSFTLSALSTAFNVCRTYPYANTATLSNAALGPQSLGVTVTAGSNMSLVVPITNARQNALAVRIKYDFDKDGAATSSGTTAQQTVAANSSSNFTIPVTASAVAGGWYGVIRVETETSTSNWNVTDSWARTSLFTVPVVAPIVNSVSPLTMIAGSGSQQLNIFGSNFQSGNVVQFQFTGTSWVQSLCAPQIINSGQISLCINPGPTADTIYVRVCNAALTACSSGTQYVTVTTPVGPATVSLVNVANHVTPSGNAQFTVLGGTTYQGTGYAATLTSLANGTWIVEGYSPPTSLGTREYWGRNPSVVVPPNQSYAIPRSEPYAQGASASATTVQQSAGSTTFSVNLAKAPGSGNSTSRAKIFVRQMASPPSGTAYPDANDLSMTTGSVSVPSGGATTANFSWFPGATHAPGDWYWTYQVETDTNPPNAYVKTDAEPWNAARKITITQLSALSLTVLNYTVGSTNPPASSDLVEARRGEKVSVRIEVRDGGSIANDATVEIDRNAATSAWLSATPIIAPTPLGNGQHVVEFYVPVASDKAVLDAVQSLSFIKASRGTTSAYLQGKSIKVRKPDYGITVMIHGYQIPFALSGLTCSRDASAAAPLTDIAQAVLARAGRGRLWQYDYNTEKFVQSAAPAGVVDDGRLGFGEQVVAIDWCDVSNNATPGYAEATAHQLYAAMKSFDSVAGVYGQASQTGLLRSSATAVHVIAHSFGSGVAFQLLRRLRHLEGFANLHLTTLDPHDFRQALTPVDGSVYMPNVDISRLNAVSGLFVADNYYERIERSGFVPSGRCVPDMSNERLDAGLVATNSTHWWPAQYHTAVHRWYLGTILPDTLTDGLTAQIIGQIFSTEANRYLFGYAKSRIGGGANFTVAAYSATCPDGTGYADDSLPDSTDVEVMDGSRYQLSQVGVFDGRFDSSLFYTKPQPRPGYRAGAGNAERYDVVGKTGMRITGASGYWDPYGALPKSNALETRMTYVGPNSQSLRFSTYVPTVQSTGTLAVSAWRPGTSGLGAIGSVDTAALSPAAWKQICVSIPQSIRDADTAAVIGFYASGTTEFTITELELSPLPCSSFSLTVRSTASGSESSGVTVTLSPAAVGGVQSLTTNATSPAFALYAPNVQVTLEAPAQSGGGNFTSWSYCDATDAALRRCTINMNGHRGAVVNYTSVAPVNGQCGSSHNAVLSSAPSVSLCSTGTASPITGNGPWNWSCGGTGGGTTASCVAQLADTTPNAFTFTSVVDVAPSTVVTSNVVTISGINVASPISIVNGTYSIGCGATFSSAASLISNGQTVCVRHSASASSTTQTTTTLTVGGVSGTFTSTTASSGTPVNGQCGTANGQIASTLPTSNLCSVGVSSLVQGTGPWTWTCIGANGGSTATCAAPIQTWIVTAGAGAGGAVSPTSQTVNSTASGTITVTPDSGYGIASVTGCGGSLVGNVYTTAAVVANCNVYASFTPTIGPVNGVCGSANGGSFSVAPTTNLCAAGTASPVTGAGPWNWTCSSVSGGTAATCSATYVAPGICSGGTNEICDLFSNVGVNTTLWNVAGSSVTQTGNGEIALTADVTDNTGRIRTLTLPESSAVTVRAKHYLVPANNYFYPMITLLDAWGNLLTALQWRKSDYEASEVCNGVSTFNHPILVVPNLTCAGASTVTSSSLYGRWSETTLTYNASTGLITVDLDSDGSIDISTTVPIAQRNTVSSVGFHGYGWFTGHLMKLDHARINYVPTATPYTLAVNAGTGGTTLPSGSSQRLAGDSVTVVAQPNSGYAFSGWTGYASCGAAATCTFTMPAAAVTLAAGFAPVQQPTSCVLDLDGDGSVSALTDGLMLVRILRGATGSAITAGVMGTGTLARPTSAAIAAFVQAMRDSMALDVDGNGVVELADALIIQRAMLGMNGESVLNGAGQTGSPARSTWLAVRDYLVQSCGMTGLSTSAGTGATGRLNDTGITWGGNFPSGNNGTCSGETIAQQDCSQGRDASALTNNNADGKAGFSFTKISNNGVALPANATLGTGANEWACTRDNVTGLMWEVKTASGLRGLNHTYSWYSSDSANNGGSVGINSGGICASVGRCDTEKFVQDVNATGLCGHNDWRVPDVNELMGIVNFGGSSPLIDTTFFPNTISETYWSSSPVAGDSTAARVVHFNFGAIRFDPRNVSSRVRAVRSVR